MVTRKSKVSFPSEDGLEITADHYYSKKSNPYIILLHQERSSRGEFDSIAERLIKMNYNCLAVDLRSGDRYGFVVNETALRAREKGLNTTLIECLKDINASIEFVKKISNLPIILLGSSFSASLAILTAKNDSAVKAVIAFSPGEFFLPGIEIKSELEDFNKPVFAGFSDEEELYIRDMFSLAVNHNNINLFSPSDNAGKRTAEALLSLNNSSDEYWLALLIFLRSIQ